MIFLRETVDPSTSDSRLITARNGDLLAVIDARRNTRDLQHTRNIDIAYKRSSDNGNS